ncbi:hypothetical protein BH20GEM2_BH20GEM2_04890 [soil metagenome]
MQSDSLRQATYGSFSPRTRPQRLRFEPPRMAGQRLRELVERGPRTLVGKVEWTLPYVALLAYIFAIVTYRLPVATPAMILGIVGLLFQRYTVRIPPLLWWFAAYLAWCLIGQTQTPYPDIVSQRIQDYGKLWLIALVVINAVRTPGQLRFFFIFFLFCFATHPARGALFNTFLYNYSPFGRVLWNGSFGNPNQLAALTFFPLAIAAGLLKVRNQWIHRGAIASVVVLPLLILMTQSRGAFLALALFAPLVWLGQRRKLQGLVLLLVVSGVVAAASPAGIWERMTKLSSEGTEADSSSRQRWAIWEIAGQIIDEHAVYGVGLGAYKYAHEVTAPVVDTDVEAGGQRDTHSTYLNVAAETGYPGLTIFLAMVIATVVSAERIRRRVKRSLPRIAAQIWFLEVGLFSFLLAGIFGTFPHLALLYLHLAAIVATAETARQALASTHPPAHRHRMGIPHARVGRFRAHAVGPASAARFPTASLPGPQPTG